MKRFAAVILALCLGATLFAGCGGGSSNLPDLSGTYVCNSLSFDIGQLAFSADGKVELSMDWEYTGTYKKSGDKYTISITGGKSSVSNLLAEERNKAYKITAQPNDDGTLTVYIDAKSGYVYYGADSAVFKKK